MASSKPLAPLPGLTPDQQKALAVLFEAYQAACDLTAKPSAFACQLSSLRDLGISDSVLRWLVAKKLAEHLLETTGTRQQRRAFRPAANLRFTPASCFVLTDAGFALAERQPAPGQVSVDPAHRANPHVPRYDADCRTLSLDGQLVKQFNGRAQNQELILLAFEEEKWSLHLADPLSGKKEIDAKHRLNRAIERLNGCQINPLLCFHGDGTGTGIRWEIRG